MNFDVYSMGFSNRTWEETLAILSGYKIRRLADIRTLPGSKHTPQFNLEHLQVALPRAGIEYVHLKALGGLRKPRRDSVLNAAWRNDAFRGYADYMQTQEFDAALNELIRLLQEKTTVYCCTEAVARILLPDAGHLQEEEANYRNKHHLTKHKPALPLYTVRDARASLELMRPVKYGEVVSLSSSLGFDMMHAGHILGSSFVRFREGSGGTQKTVLFTGDIGRYDQPIIFDPASVDAADYLILESTYGNRLHAGNE